MTNKLKYFIGNWKMFGDFRDFRIVRKINQFNYRTKGSLKKKEIILCVPNTLIHYFNKRLKNKCISLGAQNCHYHQKYGPFTGAVNAKMLKRVGAKYIILGHSENRSEGESNKLIKKKIISSLNQKLKIVFCVGETLEEKKKNKTFQVIKKQVLQSLKKNFDTNKIIIAYEPVWSIGTSKIPKINDLKKIINYIKSDLKKVIKLRNFPKVLYGGSVNSKNIRLFSSVHELDGFLVGGASQSPKEFIDIIKNYYK
tara:strand:+ start:655 stop:1416 length:762 start_codon:yes stop_codon:yes gene_type:complete